MNVVSLYEALAQRVDREGCVRLPDWDEIARLAEFPADRGLDALRALIERGAIDRVWLANTWGDCAYRLRRPLLGQRRDFISALVKPDGTVRDLVEPLYDVVSTDLTTHVRTRLNRHPMHLTDAERFRRPFAALLGRQVELVEARAIAGWRS
jgi:hypothetical protein